MMAKPSFGKDYLRELDLEGVLEIQVQYFTFRTQWSKNGKIVHTKYLVCLL